MTLVRLSNLLNSHPVHSHIIETVHLLHVIQFAHIHLRVDLQILFNYVGHLRVFLQEFYLLTAFWANILGFNPGGDAGAAEVVQAVDEGHALVDVVQADGTFHLAA